MIHIITLFCGQQLPDCDLLWLFVSFSHIGRSSEILGPDLLLKIKPRAGFFVHPGDSVRLKTCLLKQSRGFLSFLTETLNINLLFPLLEHKNEAYRAHINCLRSFLLVNTKVRRNKSVLQNLNSTSALYVLLIKCIEASLFLRIGVLKWVIVKESSCKKTVSRRVVKSKDCAI